VILSTKYTRRAVAQWTNFLVVPAIARESIRVTPDAISFHGGLWFAPADHQIPLSGVEEIVETHEAVDQRVLKRPDTFWEVRYRDRDPYRIHLSDLLGANRRRVAEYLRRHGIRVNEL
jgi:hypothetical protein